METQQGRAASSGFHLQPLESRETSGHVLLIGYGAGGRRVSAAVAELGASVLVVELDPAKAERARNEGCEVVSGDATNRSVLCAARAKGAEVVAVTPRGDDQRIVRAIRRAGYDSVILTNLPSGFIDRPEDETDRMIGRMTRLLGYTRGADTR